MSKGDIDTEQKWDVERDCAAIDDAIAQDPLTPQSGGKTPAETADKVVDAIEQGDLEAASVAADEMLDEEKLRAGVAPRPDFPPIAAFVPDEPSKAAPVVRDYSREDFILRHVIETLDMLHTWLDGRRECLDYTQISEKRRISRVGMRVYRLRADLARCSPYRKAKDE